MRSVYGVVLAQDSAAAGEGVVLELAGLLVLTQSTQGKAEEASQSSVRRWSSPRTRRLRVKASFWSCRAC